MATKRASAPRTAAAKPVPVRSRATTGVASRSKATPKTVATAAVGATEGKHAVEPKNGPKLKVVRDSFTMPQADYEKIAQLKKRCLRSSVSVKKSELLRAGLHLLERLADADLVAEIGRLESVKTGRPTNEESGKKSKPGKKRK